LSLFIDELKKKELEVQDVPISSEGKFGKENLLLYESQKETTTDENR